MYETGRIMYGINDHTSITRTQMSRVACTLCDMSVQEPNQSCKPSDMLVYVTSGWRWGFVSLVQREVHAILKYVI